jgi:tetratricopeptide (TPR) repeat protein
LQIYRSVSGGASDRFRITIDAGYLVDLLFTKRDLNLTAAVHAPDGRVLAEFISRHYGPAEFSFITDATGEHVVEVQSLEEGQETRDYELEVVNVTHARPIDMQLNTIVKDFAEAEKLSATWEKEDLKTAVRLYLRAARDWQDAGRAPQAAVGFERAGELCFILSEYSEAIGNYKKAHVASLPGSNRLAAADALNGIGYALVYEGENSKAMPYFERSLRMARQLERPSPVDAKRLMARALNNMGEVHYSLSDPDKTLDEFNRALALWQEVGDRQGQALAEINLGYLQVDLGNMSEAVGHYANALQLFRAINNRSGEASVITAIGGIHSFQGEKQDAIDSHNRALKIFRSIGDRRGEAAALNGLGQAYKSLNDPSTALGCYTRALVLYREIGYRDYEALDALYVGSTHRLNGDMTMALKFCKQSVELSRQVGDKRIEV